MKLNEVEQPNLLDVETPDLKDISKKHKVSLGYLKKQMLKGIQVEFEHTNHSKVALEIALDHLNERPDYYERLEKVEKDNI